MGVGKWVGRMILLPNFEWNAHLLRSCLRWTRKTGQLVKWESCS